MADLSSRVDVELHPLAFGLLSGLEPVTTCNRSADSLLTTRRFPTVPSPFRSTVHFHTAFSHTFPCNCVEVVGNVTYLSEHHIPFRTSQTWTTMMERALNSPPKRQSRLPSLHGYTQQVKQKERSSTKAQIQQSSNALRAEGTSPNKRLCRPITTIARWFWMLLPWRETKLYAAEEKLPQKSKGYALDTRRTRTVLSFRSEMGRFEP